MKTVKIDVLYLDKHDLSPAGYNKLKTGQIDDHDIIDHVLSDVMKDILSADLVIFRDSYNITVIKSRY